MNHNRQTRPGLPAGAIVTHNNGGGGKSVDPRALARALEPYRTHEAPKPSPDPEEEQEEGGR